MRLQPEAVHRLRLHAWPGNVRELKHVVDRLTVISETSLVTAHDVSMAIGNSEVVAELSAARQFERERLVALLGTNEWNTARVAEATGVSRTTIYRRMLRLGITPPRFHCSNSSVGHRCADGASTLAAEPDRSCRANGGS
jgi:transcriptional regulator of acetoin/glycerol metabolism